MRGTVVAVDLFAGGGGTSTGFAHACRQDGRTPKLVAVNCWPEAIAVHQANHPWARHVCQRIESIRPEDLFPDEQPEGLLASPECTWHSTARGGKPINDQLRSSPWVIPRWLDAFDLDWFIIENVPGFKNWGKLDRHGRPIKALKGQIFDRFDQVLKGYGYNVQWRVLDSANFGAYTTRPRLFGLGRRGNRPVHWPRPTHSRGGLEAGTQPWRAVRDCLDFSLPTRSIFEPPFLAWNTLRRIAAGALKRWGLDLMPFLRLVVPPEAQATHACGAEGDDVPDCAGCNPIEPFLVGNGGPTGAGQPRGVDVPSNAVLAEDRKALVQPQLDVVGPLILGQQGGATLRPVTVPGPTVPTGGALRILQPVVTSLDRPLTNRSLPNPVSGPAGTIVGKERMALLDPILVPNKGEREGQAPRFQTVDRPIWVVTATGNTASLAYPMLVSYNGNGHTYLITEPSRSPTTHDRFGLLIPLLLEDGSVARLDIRYRMLDWRELARIMGFPGDYKWLLGHAVAIPGRAKPKRITKTSIVKMVGNAVEYHVGKALALSQIRGRPMDVPQVNLPSLASTTDAAAAGVPA